MTLNDILRIYRTPISVIPDFQGPDQPYRAYRGRPDAGWMREEPWKILDCAFRYVATCWTGPGNRNLQAIIGDCGHADYSAVEGHGEGGHSGGNMVDINYFTLEPYGNRTHYPLNESRISLFDNNGKLNVSVLDVPRTWALLRFLQIAYPNGSARVDMRIRYFLEDWGLKHRGIQFGRWLIGDTVADNPEWNHDKHMHLCLSGDVPYDAEFIILDRENIKAVDPVKPYPNPSTDRGNLSELVGIMKAAGSTCPKDMADENCVLPHFEELQYALSGFNPGGPYTANDNDCDDFAFRLVGYMNSLFPAWAFGLAWSQVHAFNIAVCSDREFYVVEPQQKTIMPYKMNLGQSYKPLTLVVM